MHHLFPPLARPLGPNRYHGWGSANNYFEGWYFKFVDPTEYAFALIPGFLWGWTVSITRLYRARWQEMHSNYHDFPAEAFIPASTHFQKSILATTF